MKTASDKTVVVVERLPAGGWWAEEWPGEVYCDYAARAARGAVLKSSFLQASLSHTVGCFIDLDGRCLARVYHKHSGIEITASMTWEMDALGLDDNLWAYLDLREKQMPGWIYSHRHVDFIDEAVLEGEPTPLRFQDWFLKDLIGRQSRKNRKGNKRL